MEPQASRVGYLIDWEYGRKMNNTPIDIFNLPVCGIPFYTHDYL